MDGALIALLVVMPTAILWGAICNAQTYSDRVWLAKVVFDKPDLNWRTRALMMDEVTYNEHLRHRFFLLSPWRLYRAELLAGTEVA